MDLFPILGMVTHIHSWDLKMTRHGAFWRDLPSFCQPILSMSSVQEVEPMNATSSFLQLTSSPASIQILMEGPHNELWDSHWKGVFFGRKRGLVATLDWPDQKLGYLMSLGGGSTWLLGELTEMVAPPTWPESYYTVTWASPMLAKLMSSSKGSCGIIFVVLSMCLLQTYICYK